MSSVDRSNSLAGSPGPATLDDYTPTKQCTIADIVYADVYSTHVKTLQTHAGTYINALVASLQRSFLQNVIGGVHELGDQKLTTRSVDQYARQVIAFQIKERLDRDGAAQNEHQEELPNGVSLGRVTAVHRGAYCFVQIPSGNGGTYERIHVSKDNWNGRVPESNTHLPVRIVVGRNDDGKNRSGEFVSAGEIEQWRKDHKSRKGNGVGQNGSRG